MPLCGVFFHFHAASEKESLRKSINYYLSVTVFCTAMSAALSNETQVVNFESNRPKKSWKKNTRSSTSPSKVWSGRQPVVAANKWLKLFLSLVFLAVVAMAFVLVLFRQDTPTPLLSIAAIQYDPPWAPNGYASEDQGLLTDMLSAHQVFQVSCKQEQIDGSWQDLVDNELEKMPLGGPGGSMLPRLFGYQSAVVHFSAHGVVNSMGEPCLAFSSASPTDEQEWVPVADILDHVSKRIETHSRDWKLLVLLDIGKQPLEIRAGLIANPFVSELRKLVSKRSANNIAILTACDDGQYGWSTPELDATLFGYMMSVGLQGAADRLAGDQDGRVTVSELGQFVSATVQGYAAEFRDQVQTPQLLTADDSFTDFELCYASNAPIPTRKSKVQVDSTSGLWTRYQAWLESNDYVFNADDQRLRGIVSDYEQSSWAGSAYLERALKARELAEELMIRRATPEWPSTILGASLAFQDREVTPKPNLVFDSREQASKLAPDQKEDGSENGDEPAPETDSSSTQSLLSTDSVEQDEQSQLTQLKEWLRPMPKGDAEDGQKEVGPPGIWDRQKRIRLAIRCVTENPDLLRRMDLQRLISWIEPFVNHGGSLSNDEALLLNCRDAIADFEVNYPELQNDYRDSWAAFFRLTDKANQVLALPDDRLVAFAETYCDEANREMRFVLDQLHAVDNQADISNINRAMGKLQRDWDEIDDVFSRQAKAWQLVDQVLCEVPIAFEFVSRHSEISNSRDVSTLHQIEDTFFKLANDVWSANQVDAGQLNALRNKVDALLQTCQQRFHEIVIAEPTGQRSQMGIAWKLMHSRPLKRTIAERDQLRRDIGSRLEELDGSVSEAHLVQYLDEYQGQPGETRQLDIRLDFASRLLAWSQQGMNQLEPPSRSAFDSGKALDLEQALETGAQIRQFFASHYDWSTTQRAEIEAGLQQETTYADRYVDLAKLEAKRKMHLFASPYVYQDTQFSTDLVNFRRVTKQRVAAWWSVRHLEDFWRTPEVSSQPYMVAASDAWLSEANNFFEATAVTKRAELRRAKAIANSQQWQKMLSKSGTVSSISEGVHRLEFMEKFDAFPSGLAALRIMQEDAESLFPFRSKNREVSTDQIMLGQSPIGTLQQVELANRYAINALPAGRHRAVASYRGHQAFANIDVEMPEKSLAIFWRPDENETTTIRVEAEPEPARIVFILDCSLSFKNGLPKAKEQLKGVIRELPPLTEVALMAFGHSSTYGKSRSSPYTYAPGFEKTGRGPYNDVELLVDFGFVKNENEKRNDVFLGELESQLDRLNGHGYTPLHYAIATACQLLNRDGKYSGNRRVVVLSDGADHPYAHSNKSLLTGNWAVPGEFIYDKNRLAAVLKRAGKVQLDVVSVTNTIESDLKEIAKGTGGEVLIAKPSKVADKLKESLSRLSYSVTDIKSGRKIEEGKRIGTTYEVKPTSLPASLEVQIDGTNTRRTVSLRGGELIELQYARTGNSGTLRYLPYGKNDERTEVGTLSIGEQPYRVLVLPNMPRFQSQIRFVLQSTDPLVQSVPPKAIMVELGYRQAGLSDPKPMGWTSDNQWESRHRSPVFRALFDARKQPVNVFRVWATNDGPSERVAVRQVLDQSIPFGSETWTLELDSTAREGVLRMKQQWTENGVPLAFQLRPTSVRSARHEIFSNRQILHTYRFDRLPEDLSLEYWEVNREQWQVSDWITLPSVQ